MSTRMFCDRCNADITTVMSGHVDGIADADAQGNGNVTHGADLCVECYEEFDAWLQSRPARAPEDSPGRVATIVAGVFMDRSIADFQRACEVHIEEEQRKPNPDTALIALLCDAVRCSRELSHSNRAADR